jgi:hypothetical protein
MKATCPICGNYGPLETFLAQEDYKKALAVITALPGDLPRLSVRYLALFRKPGSDRALTGPRVLKLVSELRDLVNAQEIQWKGNRVHQNSPAHWVKAIEVILDRDSQGRIERPLDGHNYLRAIAHEQADKYFESSHRKKEQDVSYRPDMGRTDPDNEQQDQGPTQLGDVLETARRNLSGWREKLGQK